MTVCHVRLSYANVATPLSSPLLLSLLSSGYCWLHGVDLALHPGKTPCAGYEPRHKAAVLFFVLRTDGKEAKWRILKR